MSIADKLRQKLTEKAAQSTSSYDSENSELEFVPPFGTTRVRFLPPKDEDDDFFYRTHSFHFLDGISKEGKGRMIFSKKKYYFDKDGNSVEQNDPNVVRFQVCPIDEATKVLYDTKNEENKKVASSIKRKRRFYFNILLLDETDPDKKLRVLVDSSNEGKLARAICNAMGVPFCRDTEDNWFPGDPASDPDKRYYDLLDTVVGHDFKIVKTKEGNEAWDISYEKSFAIEKERPLTKDELALIENRQDLKTFIKYEQSYEKVEEALAIFLSKSTGLPLEQKSSDSKKSLDTKMTPDHEAPEVSAPKAKAAALKKEVKEVQETSEADLNDLMEELED